MSSHRSAHVAFCIRKSASRIVETGEGEGKRERKEAGERKEKRHRETESEREKRHAGEGEERQRGRRRGKKFREGASVLGRPSRLVGGDSASRPPPVPDWMANSPASRLICLLML